MNSFLQNNNIEMYSMRNDGKSVVAERFIRTLKNKTLREKCPNTELFLVRIFLYSVRIQENTDQK